MSYYDTLYLNGMSIISVSVAACWESNYQPSKPVKQPYTKQGTKAFENQVSWVSNVQYSSFARRPHMYMHK